MLPRNLNDSTAGEWGESRGVSPEVHDNLHSFECAELQVDKITCILYTIIVFINQSIRIKLFLYLYI